MGHALCASERRAKVTKRNTFARPSLLFILKPIVIRKLFCTFAPEYSSQIRICYVNRRAEKEDGKKLRNQLQETGKNAFREVGIST